MKIIHKIVLILLFFGMLYKFVSQAEEDTKKIIHREYQVLPEPDQVDGLYSMFVRFKGCIQARMMLFVYLMTDGGFSYGFLIITFNNTYNITITIKNQQAETISGETIDLSYGEPVMNCYAYTDFKIVFDSEEFMLEKVFNGSWYSLPVEVIQGIPVFFRSSHLVDWTVITNGTSIDFNTFWGLQIKADLEDRLLVNANKCCLLAVLFEGGFGIRLDGCREQFTIHLNDYKTAEGSIENITGTSTICSEFGSIWMAWSRQQFKFGQKERTLFTVNITDVAAAGFVIFAIREPGVYLCLDHVDETTEKNIVDGTTEKNENVDLPNIANYSSELVVGGLALAGLLAAIIAAAEVIRRNRTTVEPMETEHYERKERVDEEDTASPSFEFSLDLFLDIEEEGEHGNRNLARNTPPVSYLGNVF